MDIDGLTAENPDHEIYDFRSTDGISTCSSPPHARCTLALQSSRLSEIAGDKTLTVDEDFALSSSQDESVISDSLPSNGVMFIYFVHLKIYCKLISIFFIFICIRHKGSEKHNKV